MSKRVLVRGSWGPRLETPTETTARLVRFVDRLSAIDPILDGWRELGSSERQAGANPPVDALRLAGLVEAGANRGDTDGAPLVELGRQVSLWNGTDEEGSAATLSVNSGLTSPVAALLNIALVKAAVLGDAGVAHGALWALADAWEPSYAMVTTSPRLVAIEWGQRRPVVGWLTYLGPDRPRPATTIGSVDDGPHGGCIVRAADDLADVDVDLLTRLTAELDAAGARQPIPTTVE